MSGTATITDGALIKKRRDNQVNGNQVINNTAPGGGSGGGGSMTAADVLVILQDTEENVGIGTDAPGEKLEVNGNVKATALKTANYSIEEDSGALVIKYGTTIIARLTSAGYLTTKDEQEAFDSTP